jgi:hypothetical protein
MFQVVLQVSKTRFCWGDRLSFAASQKDAPPERRVKQITVQKISWKAGVSLKRFIVGFLIGLTECNVAISSGSYFPDFNLT